MRLSVYIFILTLITSNLFGQLGGNYIQLSDKITTETKNITGFDKIDISEDFKVFIRFSEKEEKVEIEANENLHDLIHVKKKGETLKIYTRPYSTDDLNKKSNAKERLVAYITVKNLREIKGDEDVEIKLENKLTTDDLTINLDEDSTLKGHIEVKNLSVELDDDSILDIKGSARAMEADANEDSLIKSFDFIVGNLVLDLSGDSTAKLTVHGNISLKASGDSYFHYKGDGNFVSKRLRGDSEVKAH